MNQNQNTPSLQIDRDIKWQNFNYPPVLRLFHFSIQQIPQQKKFVIRSLFAVHLLIFVNCLLNILDNVMQGSIGILYSILFFLFFNPLVLLMFHKTHRQICDKLKNIKISLILIPAILAILILGSIIDTFGFNGFVKIQNQFKTNHGIIGIFSLIVDFIFFGSGIFLVFIYILILKNKKSWNK